MTRVRRHSAIVGSGVAAMVAVVASTVVAVATAGGGAATPAITWTRNALEGNLQQLLGMVNGVSNGTYEERDLPNGALTSLLLKSPTVPPSAGDCPPTDVAARLLVLSGPTWDMSFTSQAIPPLYHGFFHCFNATFQAWINDTILASLPATMRQATTADVSYTNMFLMPTVNSLLLGEVVGGAAGSASASVGHEMLQLWLNYTAAAGFHEFTSPTYTNVQVSALYMGYIHARDAGVRRSFGVALDYLWSDTAANAFNGSLSGPHSRDYDTLLGHGMFNIDMYLQGMPGSQALVCEYRDPHCEGPANTVTDGTGEPMLAPALSLYNAMHAGGYAPSAAIRALSFKLPRVVTSRFLAQNVTTNGNFARFAQLYNYVTSDYAIGSASQDYITNTHSLYEPYPGDKLVNVVLGDPMARVPRYHNRPRPAVTLQPEAFNPYGIWREYPTGEPDKATHLAVHPGMVQHEAALLATLSLNAQDKRDGFTPTSNSSLWTTMTTSIILPLDATIWVQPADTTPGHLFQPPDTAFGVPLPVDATVAVQVDNSAVAFRFTQTDGAGGQTPTVAATGSTIGMPLGAMAVTLTHFASNTPTALNDTNVRVAVLLVADSVSTLPDLQALAKRVAVAPTSSNVVTSAGGWQEWQASATVDGTALEVGRNLTCGGGGRSNQTVHTSWNCLTYRRVAGKDVVVTPLSVNGVVVDPFHM